jgi:hypothetical protein
MVVYSEYYDRMGILEGNLVRIDESDMFIPFTFRWVVLGKD